MTDDFSLLRLDIDGEAMRALLEALGVPPSAFAEFETDADEDGPESASRSTPPATSRSGPRIGETPPPGAGEQVSPDASEDDESGRRRMLLLAGAGAAVLGVVAVAGALLYRHRSESGDLPIPDVPGPDLPTPDLDRVTGAFGGDEGSVDTEAVPAAEQERESSRIDVAPLVGMAALAVGGVFVRAITARDE